LQQGLDVAFLTLGDPTVYSTYGYLQKRIGRLGYETEIISGVPSFCAAAAKLGIPLAEGSQQLHVIPAGYRLEESMDLTGTKVYMKAGSRMAALKEHLQEVPGSVYMVENCGMEGEKLCRCAKELDETAGYYSIVLVKEEKDV
jgi:precorrin-2/cobalt-factor-2 C20-methyltransferase